MGTVDYMKVLDVIVQTLDLNSQFEIKALDLKIFNAVLTRSDGFKSEVTLKIYPYDLEIYLKKDVFAERDFNKWLKKFEYQLEQVFFKNITLTTSDTKTEYRIKMSY